MKIGFVVAMEKEANLLLKIADIEKNYSYAGKNIFVGKVFNKEFVLIIAGIGKVNASLGTQILIDKYDIDCIINFGLAGGKENSNLNAGDVVQVNSSCQYDFDLSELDDVKIGYMQDYNLIFYPLNICEKLKDQFPPVVCATADRFTSKQYFLNIVKTLNAQITDMEVGAIAQTCFANQKPLYALKLISDVDGKTDSIYAQYANNAQSICSKLPTAIALLLKNL